MISNDISDSILCFVKHYNSCLPIKCHCSDIKLHFMAKSTQSYESFIKVIWNRFFWSDAKCTGIAVQK